MKHIRVSELSKAVTVDELRNETRPPQLAEFCAAVQRELRGIKFTDHSMHGVVAFYPNDVFALGVLMYADMRDTGDGERMYCVQSNHIVNDKYSEGRPQHNMKMSKNLDVALRNCKKFLRSYTPEMMRAATIREFSSSIHNARADLDDEVATLRDKLFNSRYGRLPDKLMSELRHMVNSSHMFVDAEFGSTLASYFVKRSELDSLESSGDVVNNIYFVRVGERFGKQSFDVVWAMSPSHMSKDEFVTEHHTTDTLPEWLMERMAVLQMMEPFTFIEGVGASAGDGMFYAVR